MLRILVGIVLPASLMLIALDPAFGCKCAGRSSVCGAFSGTQVIIAGRVESIQPNFDPWDHALDNRIAQLFPGRDLDDVEGDETAETLKKLKDLYAGVFSEPFRTQIARAATRKQLELALEGALDEGKRVTFRVQQSYKGLAPDTSTLDIWTDFTDCGQRFIKGETYLVYAWAGEKGRLQTGACSRNSRLSDAGEDLVYLQFRQSGLPGVGRIYGFVTSNERDLSTPLYWDRVSAPTPNLIIQLKQGEHTLLSETNKEGRFIFDGLSEGEYEILVTKDLEPAEPLNEPRRVHISGDSCKSELFYIPNVAPHKK